MYSYRSNRNINNSIYDFPSELEEYEYRKPRGRSKSGRKNLNNNVAAVSLRRDYPKEAMRESTEDRNTNVDVGLMDIKVMREFMRQRAPAYFVSRYGYSPFAQFEPNEMIHPRYRPAGEHRMEVIEESDDEDGDDETEEMNFEQGQRIERQLQDVHYVPDAAAGEGPSHGVRAQPPVILPSDDSDDD